MRIYSVRILICAKSLATIINLQFITAWKGIHLCIDEMWQHKTDISMYNDQIQVSQSMNSRTVHTHRERERERETAAPSHMNVRPEDVPS